MTEIDSFKPPAAKQAGKKSGPATPGATPGGNQDHVTYQLFHRPEQAKFSNNAKVCCSIVVKCQTLNQEFWGVNPLAVVSKLRQFR